MKTNYVLSALPILARTAAAHGVFAHLVVNGTITGEWEYVRDIVGDPAYADYDKDPQYNPQWSKRPGIFDIYSPAMVCGREAFKSAAKTKTATVIAGSQVGFKMADIAPEEDVIFHDGPGQAYLSRAPNDDLANYDGKGDWFKVAYAGPSDDKTWSLKWKNGWNFTIPKTVPPGKYLLRMEQFQPYSVYNMSQWYINCAHVNIVGPGGGTPTNFAHFPGEYDIEHPGIHIPEKLDFALVTPGVTPCCLTEYQPPGPPLWIG